MDHEYSSDLIYLFSYLDMPWNLFTDNFLFDRNSSIYKLIMLFQVTKVCFIYS